MWILIIVPIVPESRTIRWISGVTWRPCAELPELPWWCITGTNALLDQLRIVRKHFDRIVEMAGLGSLPTPVLFRPGLYKIIVRDPVALVQSCTFGTITEFPIDSLIPFRKRISSADYFVAATCFVKIINLVRKLQRLWLYIRHTDCTDWMDCTDRMVPDVPAVMVQ